MKEKMIIKFEEMKNPILEEIDVKNYFIPYKIWDKKDWENAMHEANNFNKKFRQEYIS